MTPAPHRIPPCLAALLAALLTLAGLFPATVRPAGAAAAAPAPTPNSTHEALEAAPLRVFILDQPPWSCTCGGQALGGAVDVARVVLHRLGRSVEFQTLPFNRGVELVAQGKLDAALGLYRTPKRETRFHFSSVPLYDDEVVMLVPSPVSGNAPGAPTPPSPVVSPPKTSPPDSGTTRDAALYGDKPLAVVLGYSYGLTLDTLFAQKGMIRISSVYSLEEAVQALLDGRVGGVPGDRLTLRQLVRRLAPGAEPTLVGPPFDYVSAYMAFAPNEANIALARDFDRTLGQMRASGEYAAIIAEAFRIHDAHHPQ